MEENRTYGRKVIRDEKSPRKSQFGWGLLFITIMILFMVIALIVVQDHEPNVIEEPEAVVDMTPTEAPKNKNEEILEHVQKFGSHDDRIFTEEPSFNWSVNAIDFEPLDCGLDTNLQEFTYYLCESYNIDWTLVVALMKLESDFQVDNISPTNDYGLMQINKCNHEWLSETLGITDFLDPYQNIRAGVFVLRKLFETYEDPAMVLMAYNRGENGAKRLWDKGIYSIPYSNIILTYQKEFNERKGSNDNN